MCSGSIGNDIVDLNFDICPVHIRFKQRVFTSDEIAYIGESKKKFWLCWTAKEAAYKAFKRMCPDIFFSPVLFRFNHKLSTVEYNGSKLHSKHKITDDFIYTVCSTTKNILNSDRLYTWSGKADNAADGSVAVRQLASEKISRLLRVDQEKINFIKSPDGIPELTIKGAGTKGLLSFSHHGRYVLSSYLHTEEHYNRPDFKAPPFRVSTLTH